jgi:lysozyme family protein
MRANLAAILKLSTANEGGFVNHPKDPGGATNHGITIGTLSAYLGRKASIADVRALSVQTAVLIYVKNYWAPVGGDELPAGLDYAMFDFGINSGPARAVKTLQSLLPGVAVDGQIGKKTLNAVQAADTALLIRKLCTARVAYCHGLNTWGTFGRGWTYRITGVDPKGEYKRKAGVVGDALAMMQAKPVYVVPHPVELVSGKARDESTKLLTPVRNKLQIGAIASASAGSAAQWAANNLPTFTQAAGMLEPYKDSVKVIGYGFVALTVACAVLTVALNIDKIREAGSHA